jgi:hypothetical protein
VGAVGRELGRKEGEGKQDRYFIKIIKECKRMLSKNEMIKNFKSVGEKYGFPVVEKGNKATLKAINTDGKQVDWIKYNRDTDIVTCIGNTDQCNIWLRDTRKDLTAEKIMQFVDDLNKVFDLQGDKFTIRNLIDPEDWQEITNVPDAHADARYI